MLLFPRYKSGYHSCKEKHNFFAVPKDDIKIRQWTKAILKKNILVKPLQLDYKWHFHEEEIISKRVMTDKNDIF